MYMCVYKTQIKCALRVSRITQVRSQPKDRKLNNIFKSLWEKVNPITKNRVAKIDYGHLWPSEIDLMFNILYYLGAVNFKG